MSEQQFFKFPDGFLWGAATSHFQVEGHPVEIQKRASDWAQWTTISGKIQDNTNADTACEFHTRYPSDIEICRELHLNSFRLSLNWCALCPQAPDPEGDVVFEPSVTKYYRDLLTDLRKDGIKTFVTLFHFCLPKWLAEHGGWLAPEAVTEFARFSRKAAEAFGDLVDYWITINEPLAYAYQGYVAGVWPPGKGGEYLGAFQCVKRLLEAHAQSYRAIHLHDPRAMVSYTHHWRPFIAKNRISPLDQMVRYFRDYVFNQIFPRAVQQGELSFPFPLDKMKGVRELAGPIEGLKETVDFLAVNYYTRDLCQYDFSHPLDFFGKASQEHELEVNGLGWEVYPDGLYYLLTCDLVPFRYNADGSQRPIFITENGYATIFPAELTDGDWSLADDSRVQYMVSHLMAVHHAIQDGANVKGYLYWSLLDNFEWAEGLRARFGLVRVAYPTQERTLRKSAKIFAEMAKENGLDLSWMY